MASLKLTRFLNQVNNQIPNTVKEAMTMLDNKQISAVELTQHNLDTIKQKDKQVNAYISTNVDALTEAKQADEKRAKGESGALLGVPVAYKDIFSTKGIANTAASNVLNNYVSPYDATSVSRLKKSGAITLGKTNLDAWAHGASGENSDFGPTHNPYDLGLTPGGSSSGSAASVASKMSLVAMGTDTGGSIRYPAGFCNVVGLKPTYGRVSRYGVIAMGSSFDSIGHVTNTVEDSAIVLSVTAGIDPRDGTTGNQPVPDYLSGLNKPVKGVKLGIIKEFMTKGLDGEINASFQQACKTLESLGCELVEISLPHIDYAIATYYILVPAEVSSNLNRMDGVRFGNHRSSFSAEAKRRIMIGTYTLSSGYYDAYYDKALKVRTLIVNDFATAFDAVDAIIAPTSPTPPFKLGEKATDPLAMYLSDVYVCPINLAGVPAISVPMQPAHNLPCGLQFVGKQFDEETILRLGHAFEKARGDIRLSLKV